MTWIFYGREILHVFDTQLKVFHASKLPKWLNYVKFPSTKKNMIHRKHVTPEKVSTSTNFNICNILLHSKTTIAKIEW
jgi:hypothetical protein